MKQIILTMLLITSIEIFCQSKVSSSEVFPKSKYAYLLKSPTTYTCDSLGDFQVVGSFYYNKMPLADNSKINWRAYIGQNKGNPAPYNLPPCSKLEIQRIFIFFEDEVYINSYKGVINKEAKKMYSYPNCVVIEYLNVTENKMGYLRSSGNLISADVD